jgi:hypothetical protein
MEDYTSDNVTSGLSVAPMAEWNDTVSRAKVVESLWSRFNPRVLQGEERIDTAFCITVT